METLLIDSFVYAIEAMVLMAIMCLFIAVFLYRYLDIDIMKTIFIISLAFGIIAGFSGIIAGSAYYFCSYPDKPEQSGGGLTIDTRAESTENMDVEEEEPVEDPMFTATGFYDSSLSKTEKMCLVNDAENQIGDLTVYLQYVVSEGDKTVYETDLIEPGKFVEWVPGESLDVGVHEVSILEQPYTLEDGEFVPKFSCVQNIKITIEE